MTTAIKNDYTPEQLDELTSSIAENLARAISTDEKMAGAKAASAQLTATAYEAAHNYMESLGLPRGADGGGKVYRANGLYGEFQRDVCIALSKRLKDKVEVSKRGDNIYSPRVKKQFSRLVVAYREETTETQSEADKHNKAVAKLKRDHNAKKAVLFDLIVDAVLRNSGDELQALLKRATEMKAACDEDIAQL